MKKHRLYLVFTLLIVALLISACGVNPAATSWPGLSAAENMAFIAHGSQVFAVRVNDGSLAWQFPEKADAKVAFYATPILTQDGQLLVGSYNSTLYSLNPQNGQVNWTYEDPKGRFIGSPQASEEAIYAPSTDKTLYTLDLKGNPRWKYQTRNQLWATPAVNENKVYLSSMDHFLYALDKENGQRIWQADLGSAVIGTPALSEQGVLYVGTLEKEMIAVEAATGVILNRFPLEGGVWSGPQMRENTLYFGDLTGTFIALDATTGQIVWQHQTGSPIVGTPLQTENGLIFGTEAGNLISVDFNGNILWNKTINGKLYTTPVKAGNLYLIGLNQPEQFLQAYDENGNQVWVYPPPQ